MFNFFLWSCFAPGWFWLGFVFVNKPVYSQRWLKYEWQGITVKMTQLMHMCVVGSYITEWECLLMLMTVFPWWGMNITQAGSDWRSAAARHCAVEQALFSSRSADEDEDDGEDEAYLCVSCLTSHGAVSQNPASCLATQPHRASQVRAEAQP